MDEIRKELDGNPVLADADETADPKTRGDSADKSLPLPSSHELPPEERIGITERIEPDTDMAARETEKRVQEVDWEQFLENRQLQQALPSTRSGFDELPPIEQNLTKPANLRDHLLWQLQMSDSRSSSSATSTTRATSTSTAASGRTARRTPTSPSRTWPSKPTSIPRTLPRSCA